MKIKSLAPIIEYLNVDGSDVEKEKMISELVQIEGEEEGKGGGVDAARMVLQSICKESIENNHLLLDYLQQHYPSLQLKTSLQLLDCLQYYAKEENSIDLFNKLFNFSTSLKQDPTHQYVAGLLRVGIITVVGKMNHHLLQDSQEKHLVGSKLLECLGDETVFREKIVKAAWQSLKAWGYSPLTLITETMHSFISQITPIPHNNNNPLTELMHLISPSPQIILEILYNLTPVLLVKRYPLFMELIDKIFLERNHQTIQANNILNNCNTSIPRLILIYQRFPRKLLEHELNYLMFRAFYDEKILQMKNIFLEIFQTFLFHGSPNDLDQSPTATFSSNNNGYQLSERFMKDFFHFLFFFKTSSSSSSGSEGKAGSSGGGSGGGEVYILPPCSLQIIMTQVIRNSRSYDLYDLPDLPKSLINSYLLAKNKIFPFNMLVANIQYQIFHKFTFSLFTNVQQNQWIEMFPISSIVSHFWAGYRLRSDTPVLSKGVLMILQCYFNIKRHEKERMLASLLSSLPMDHEVTADVFDYFLFKYQESLDLLPEADRESVFPSQNQNYSASSVCYLLTILLPALNLSQLTRLRQFTPFNTFPLLEIEQRQAIHTRTESNYQDLREIQHPGLFYSMSILILNFPVSSLVSHHLKLLSSILGELSKREIEILFSYCAKMLLSVMEDEQNTSNEADSCNNQSYVNVILNLVFESTPSSRFIEYYQTIHKVTLQLFSSGSDLSSENMLNRSNLLLWNIFRYLFVGELSLNNKSEADRVLCLWERVPIIRNLFPNSPFGVTAPDVFISDCEVEKKLNEAFRLFNALSAEELAPILKSLLINACEHYQSIIFLIVLLVNTPLMMQEMQKLTQSLEENIIRKEWDSFFVFITTFELLDEMIHQIDNQLKQKYMDSSPSSLRSNEQQLEYRFIYHLCSLASVIEGIEMTKILPALLKSLHEILKLLYSSMMKESILRGFISFSPDYDVLALEEGKLFSSIRLHRHYQIETIEAFVLLATSFQRVTTYKRSDQLNHLTVIVNLLSITSTELLLPLLNDDKECINLFSSFPSEAIGKGSFFENILFTLFWWYQRYLRYREQDENLSDWLELLQLFFHTVHSIPNHVVFPFHSKIIEQVYSSCLSEDKDDASLAQIFKPTLLYLGLYSSHQEEKEMQYLENQPFSVKHWQGIRRFLKKDKIIMGKPKHFPYSLFSIARFLYQQNYVHHQPAALQCFQTLLPYYFFTSSEFDHLRALYEGKLIAPTSSSYSPVGSVAEAGQRAEKQSTNITSRLNHPRTKFLKNNLLKVVDDARYKANYYQQLEYKKSLQRAQNITTSNGTVSTVVSTQKTAEPHEIELLQQKNEISLILSVQLLSAFAPAFALSPQMEEQFFNFLFESSGSCWNYFFHNNHMNTTLFEVGDDAVSNNRADEKSFLSFESVIGNTELKMIPFVQNTLYFLKAAIKLAVIIVRQFLDDHVDRVVMESFQSSFDRLMTRMMKEIFLSCLPRLRSIDEPTLLRHEASANPHSNNNPDNMKDKIQERLQTMEIKFLKLILTFWGVKYCSEVLPNGLIPDEIQVEKGLITWNFLIYDILIDIYLKPILQPSSLFPLSPTLTPHKIANFLKEFEDFSVRLDILAAPVEWQSKKIKEELEIEMLITKVRDYLTSNHSDQIIIEYYNMNYYLLEALMQRFFPPPAFIATPIVRSPSEKAFLSTVSTDNFQATLYLMNEMIEYFVFSPFNLMRSTKAQSYIQILSRIFRYLNYFDESMKIEWEKESVRPYCIRKLIENFMNQAIVIHQREEQEQEKHGALDEEEKEKKCFPKVLSFSYKRYQIDLLREYEELYFSVFTYLFSAKRIGWTQALYNHPNFTTDVFKEYTIVNEKDDIFGIILLYLSTINNKSCH